MTFPYFFLQKRLKNDTLKYSNIFDVTNRCTWTASREIFNFVSKSGSTAALLINCRGLLGRTSFHQSYSLIYCDALTWADIIQLTSYLFYLKIMRRGKFILSVFNDKYFPSHNYFFLV